MPRRSCRSTCRTRRSASNRDVDLGLVGDVGVILAAVTQPLPAATRLPRKPATRGSRTLRAKENAAVEARLPKLRSDAGRSIRIASPTRSIEFLTDNSIFVGDGGDVVTFAGNVVRPKAPGLWMDPGPLGTLGVGTGFAMAAKLAQPESRSRRAFRRRFVRDDRLRHADGDALRTAVHRDRRQQLAT